MTSFDWPSFVQAANNADSSDTTPLILTVPSPDFVEGVASSYDLDQHMFAPGGAPLTAVMNTGSFPLPSGVTLSASPDNNSLEYDGVGAVGVSGSHTLTGDDGTTQSSASSAFNITIASAATESPHFPAGHFPGSHFPSSH